MRVIRVRGANDGSQTNIKSLNGGSRDGKYNDYLRLLNVLRLRDDCNWETAEFLNLETADGYLFNVKE